LSVVLHFVSEADPALFSKIAADVINGCLVKAQLSSRAKTKELVSDIILMYIEIEKHEIVFEELLKCLENKTPKIVVGSVGHLKESLKQFGPKIYKLPSLIKILPSLLEHKDPNIREESKQLTIEIYKWLKDGLRPQLQSLKPVLLNELEEEFGKVNQTPKPTVTRYLRSEQVRTEEAVECENTVEQTDGLATSKAPVELEIDPYDLYEPAEILSKIPADFYEKLEAKKWQDRKEALVTLQSLINPHLKLMHGDYGELVKALKKLVSKDTNVVVVGLAAKALADLANKLRKGFHAYSNSCVLVVLEKFKEKKQNVVIALREAINAFMLSTNLESVSENIVEALDSKNPQIRLETAAFITRYSASSDPAIWGNKKILNSFIDGLIKGLNYNDPSVREASAEAIGTIMKVIGEKAMNPYLNDIDSLKLAKIKEYYEKAQVKYTAPVATSSNKSIKLNTALSSKTITSSKSNDASQSNDSGQAKTVKKVEPKPKSKPVKSEEPSTVVVKPASTNSTAKPTVVKPKVVTAPKARVKSATSVTSSKTETSAVSEAVNLPLLEVNNMAEQRLNDEKALKVLKWNFTIPREEFFVQLKEQMTAANWNENLVINCFHSNFKFHLKAVESLNDFLDEGNAEATLANSDLILKWIALRFFDTNPSVILKTLDYLIKFFQAFINKDQKLSEAEAQSFIPYLIQKAGDPKDVFRSKVHKILETIREIYPQPKLFGFIIQGLTSKNSRQRATCLDELGCLISNSGLGVCQPSVSLSLKEIGKQIGDKDSSVRNAALNCVVIAHQIDGEKVFKYIGSLPDKDMSMLEERIKRAAKTRSHLPKALLNQKQERPEGSTGLIKIVSSSVLKSETEYTPKTEVAKGLMRTPSTPVMRINEEKNFSTITKPVSNLVARDIEDNYNTPPSDISSRRLINTGTITKQKIHSYSTGYGPNEGENRRESIIQENVAASSTRTRYSIDNYHEEKMQEVENVEELLNLPQIELPKRLSQSGRLSISPRSAGKSSPSSAERGSRIINSVITQLSSLDIQTVTEALVQLKQALTNPERAEQYLSSKVDQIVLLCNMQYKYIMQKHMSDENVTPSLVIDLIKILNLALQSIFNHPVLRKMATRDVLKELISSVLSLLLDERMSLLPDGSQLISSTSLLANSIICYSNCTHMLSALIKLLQECLLSSNQHQEKFIDLVMKCIWKMSRLLDSYIHELNIDRIMADVHAFLESFPSEFWKSGDKVRKDTPMRTIKTIVYLTIKQVKEDILNHLTLIPNKEESELYNYIQKALKQIKKDEQASEASSKHISSLSTTSSSSSSSTSHSSNFNLSATSRIELNSIISKLGTSNTDEGLNLLFNFCQTHPSFDIKSFLEATSSEFFTKFALDGLAKVKQEKKRESLNRINSENANEELTNGVKNCSSILNLSQTKYSNAADFESIPTQMLNTNLILNWYKKATGEEIKTDLKKEFEALKLRFKEKLKRDTNIANMMLDAANKRSAPYLSK